MSQNDVVYLTRLFSGDEKHTGLRMFQDIGNLLGRAVGEYRDSHPSHCRRSEKGDSPVRHVLRKYRDIASVNPASAQHGGHLQDLVPEAHI